MLVVELAHELFNLKHQNVKNMFLTKLKTRKLRCKWENFPRDKVSRTGTLSEIGSEMTSLAPVLKENRKKETKINDKVH